MALVAAGRDQTAQNRADATDLLHGFVRDVDEGGHAEFMYMLFILGDVLDLHT